MHHGCRLEVEDEVLEVHIVGGVCECREHRGREGFGEMAFDARHAARGRRGGGDERVSKCAIVWRDVPRWTK